MTRKPTVAAWLWLIALGVLLASAAANAADPYAKGLLWRVERDGVAPSYVFGTIHSEDPRVLRLAKPAQAAFDGANTFVMEVLLDQDVMAQMASTMVFSDGRTLPDVLRPDTYRKAVAAMTGFGIPELALQAMQPWAIAVTLSAPKPESGQFLDVQLLQRAQAQGKQTAGLETAQEQLGIFASLSMPEQVTMLEDVLRHQAEFPRVFADLHAAYLARDLVRLERLSAEQQAIGDPALTKKLMGRLLDERNPRMAERMEPFLRQGGAFVAIGALHLGGPTGVLAQLAKKGYRLRAVY